MRHVLARTLQFLQVTEDDGNLSITSIAMWIVLAKIAVTHNGSVADLASFFIATASFMHKRHLDSSTQPPPEVVRMAETVSEVSEKLNVLVQPKG